jgi:hypothetical protein
LQEFPAKNVFERLAQQLRFGRKQRAPERCLPPGCEGGIAIEKWGTANWHDVALVIV